MTKASSFLVVWRGNGPLWSVLFIFLGLGLGVVEGKVEGGDYRKRSKAQECARVERKVEGAER
jgi:hypothetical protein